MKKFLFTITIIFFSVEVFAQDCIPNPTAFVKEIGNYIINNDINNLKNQALTWEEVKPIYEYVLVTSNEKSSVKLKEKITRDIDRVNRNCDSLTTTFHRKGITLLNFTVHNDNFEVFHKADFPKNCFIADGELYLQSGDTTIEITYTFFYQGKQWRLLRLNDYFSIYYRGRILSTSNFDGEGSTAVVDSTITPATEIAAYTMPAIPHFADPEVQKYVEEYAALMKRAKDVQNNPEEAQKYAIEAQEFTTKYQKLIEKISSLPQSEMKKFSDFALAITKYFYPETYYEEKPTSAQPKKPAKRKTSGVQKQAQTRH